LTSEFRTPQYFLHLWRVNPIVDLHLRRFLMEKNIL
jgi:hypothetical protein